MKILWKEWQQQKWLFFIGCMAGISIPVFDCLVFWSRNGDFRKYMSDAGSAILLSMGALFALILAISTTHHDTKKGTDDFWQSKPVRPWKLFTTKFLLAAVLLFIAFLLTISLDFITHSKRSSMTFFAWEAFCYTYPIALLLFSLTMFLVVVVRDTAKAALIAIWAGLLVYFLPLLSGLLGWMNVFEKMDNAQQRTSLFPFLLWYFTLPRKITSGTLYRPASIPIDMVQMTFGKGLWKIVTSSDYIQFLMFLAVMIIGAVMFAVLATIAFKRKWRRQPGQKSIVWALGLSAAFIFGVAMLQVGHNLEPVKQWNGKEIINPAPFDAEFMSAAFYKNLPGTEPNAFYQIQFNDPVGASCVKEDLMCVIRCGYLWDTARRVSKYWDEDIIKHFVLQIYRFPYAGGIKTSKSSRFGVGATTLFSTEPERACNQTVLGCFVRGNYLYAAFHPQIGTKKDKRYVVTNRPIYFSTIDISNPAEPRLVSNIEVESTSHFLKAFAHYGNYCYLSDGGRMIIISVEQSDKPEVARQIPYATGGQSEFNAGFPSYGFSVVGDKMLCRGYNRVAILDLNEPAKPKIIYDETFAKEQYYEDEKIGAAAYKDDYLYIATNNGLNIRRLIKQSDGRFSSELIGKRIATPIEKLAGSKPNELLFFKGWLIEHSGGFGVIVYDVSNPENPKRVFHADTGSWAFDVGIWNELLYIHTYDFQIYFFDIPETN